jgi:hypothetical protein
MRETASLRKAVEQARRWHRDLAEDRHHGDGQLGDAELLNLLMVPYPTIHGQRN